MCVGVAWAWHVLGVVCAVVACGICYVWRVLGVAWARVLGVVCAVWHVAFAACWCGMWRLLCAGVVWHVLDVAYVGCGVWRVLGVACAGCGCAGCGV